MRRPVLDSYSSCPAKDLPLPLEPFEPQIPLPFFSYTYEASCGVEANTLIPTTATHTGRRHPPHTAKELPTLKDNDFINEGQKIYIDDNNKKVFLEKLKKDVEFLAQLKLMDYSLLVGIHDVERAEQEEVECEENDGEEDGESDGTHPVGTPPDSPGNTLNSSPPLAPGEFDPNIDVYGIKCHENSPRKEVYFMAIIDILTHYDAKKKAAHAAKTVKHGAGAEISTVNPEQYSKRFLDFIGHILT
ncbi:hypothetical protein GH733_012086 [Mirounga leonina]|nr:hypothetical protein GH733_012086 [Mirounga leonina]